MEKIKITDLVSLKVAVKLKEVGFDEPTKNQIGTGSEQIYDYGNMRNSEMEEGLVACPTWQQAVEWILNNRSANFHKMIFALHKPV